MNTETPLTPSSSPEPQERNWLPLVIASAAVLLVLGIIALVQHGQNKAIATTTPVSAALDAYAANLPITNIVMSESANLAGGKMTYIDGHIANHGGSTVSLVMVQVIFRDYKHEVAQNETLPIKLIRMKEPYVDVENVSAAPLKPGAERDFRLIFDEIKPDWDGAYPEVRVVHVLTK